MRGKIKIQKKKVWMDFRKFEFMKFTSCLRFSVEHAKAHILRRYFEVTS